VDFAAVGWHWLRNALMEESDAGVFRYTYLIDAAQELVRNRVQPISSANLKPSG
jgi:hypothetical protein